MPPDPRASVPSPRGNDKSRPASVGRRSGTRSTGDDGRSPACDGRALALGVLQRVWVDGAFAAHALRGAFAKHPDLAPEDRALATELVYGVLRRRTQLDCALRHASGKRLKDLPPTLHDVLRIGAYQILFLERIPDHATVDEAVRLGKKRLRRGGGERVNAILRNLLRMEPEDRLRPPSLPPKDAAGKLAFLGSMPRTLAEQLLEDLGEDSAFAFAEASLKAAPTTLRTNLLKARREDLVQELGGQAGQHPAALRLPERLRKTPQNLDVVKRGLATVQGEASMAVTDLLAPEAGERIFDACAAPGGKTTHIAELMGDAGTVLAFDLHPERLKQVAVHAERLGLGSIQSLEAWPEGQGAFERVLLDAPCSGLGTLRQHPEIKWRFQRDRLESLQRTQRDLIEKAQNLVKVGGVLVYSVCSVLKGEGEDQLAHFGPAFDLEASKACSPDKDGLDGFFMARLRRRA